MISKKSRLVTLLLAIFLGTLGIHRIYVGKVWTGLTQMLLTLSFIGWVVSFIWVIIDWVIIISGDFTDGKGQVIKRWE